MKSSGIAVWISQDVDVRTAYIKKCKTILNFNAICQAPAPQLIWVAHACANCASMQGIKRTEFLLKAYDSGLQFDTDYVLAFAKEN